jgi:hypothetical protein
MAEKRDAIERLQSFLAGHKARSCTISIDNGYGATCWSMELYLEGRKMPLEASEAGIMRTEEDAGRDPDWPGLAAVIHHGIDEAERLLGATPDESLR